MKQTQLHSAESRALARQMADRDGSGRMWEQQAMRRYEQLKEAALAQGPGIDTPAWLALEEFLAECQIEAQRRGAHTPAYLEFKACFDAYLELSEQVRAQGAKADAESVKQVREWGTFFEECVREWRAEGVLKGRDDLLGYATPGVTPPLSQWKQEGAINE